MEMSSGQWGTGRTKSLILIATLVFLVGAPRTGRAQEHPQAPVVRVAYFVPADREPAPDHIERFDRILRHVQAFYRDGMEQNGFGAVTFALDRDAAGALEVLVVRGERPVRDYSPDSSAEIFEQVRAGYRGTGIDVDQEFVVVLQASLAPDDGCMVERGPFHGQGSHYSGLGFAMDDALLDPVALSSEEPGAGFKGHPISVGRFNSYYLGGLAHELGHAFGLPHVAEQPADRSDKGTALMGGGNLTYGDEVRGDGRGSFLTAASAIQLAAHPLFRGSREGADSGWGCYLASTLKIEGKGRGVALTGTANVLPPAVGVVALADPAGHDDYDAVGWPGRLRGQRYDVAIEELVAGASELRLRVVLQTGAICDVSLPIVVDPALGPIVDGPRLHIAYRAALDAFEDGDAVATRRYAAKVTRRAWDQGLGERARRLSAAMRVEPQVDPWSVPASRDEVPLSSLVAVEETVGWGEPYRNRAFVEGSFGPLLLVGGEFYEDGLWAHAPARHVFDLRGAWSTLTTRYGLLDGRPGSVVFVVRGDGEELFRSPRISEGEVGVLEVSLVGVDELELVVEDAGDGLDFDWAAWLSPSLKR